MKKPPGYDNEIIYYNPHPAKPKQKYAVYYCAAYYVEKTFEDLGHLGLYEWQHIGDTWAVSERQAINNVRHRLTADEYDRICDGKCPLDFKAEIIKGENEND